jgi:hypothetical protein
MSSQNKPKKMMLKASMKGKGLPKLLRMVMVKYLGKLHAYYSIIILVSVGNSNKKHARNP